MNTDFNQNKLFRTTLFCPIMLYRIVRRAVYCLSRDSKYIKSLKNTKIGKTCIVLGNGPSLSTSDIEAVSRYDVFATNRIYAIFSLTNWRPTYYVVIDNNVIKDNLEEILKVKADYKFLNYSAKYRFRRASSIGFKYINIFGRYLINPAAFETKEIRYDVSKSFSLSYSVTGVAIELAVFMGYKRIILIGMDHNYANVITKEGKRVTQDGVKDYFGNLESKDYSIQYVDAVNSYFRALKKHAEKYGCKVFNATRGGKLEEFERISLDDFIKGDY